MIGILCNLLVGYGSRSAIAVKRFLLILPMVIGLSFMLIADIDSPRNGMIRVVPQDLLGVMQSLPKP